MIDQNTERTKGVSKVSGKVSDIFWTVLLKLSQLFPEVWILCNENSRFILKCIIFSLFFHWENFIALVNNLYEQS